MSFINHKLKMIVKLNIIVYYTLGMNIEAQTIEINNYNF